MAGEGEKLQKNDEVKTTKKRSATDLEISNVTTHDYEKNEKDDASTPRATKRQKQEEGNDQEEKKVTKKADTASSEEAVSSSPSPSSGNHGGNDNNHHKSPSSDVVKKNDQGKDDGRGKTIGKNDDNAVAADPDSGNNDLKNNTETTTTKSTMKVTTDTMIDNAITKNDVGTEQNDVDTSTSKSTGSINVNASWNKNKGVSTTGNTGGIEKPSSDVGDATKTKSQSQSSAPAPAPATVVADKKILEYAVSPNSNTIPARGAAITAAAATATASTSSKASGNNKTKTKPKNAYDSLKYIMVRNDGKPESLIKLVALKSLFSRQLPKMPRTYIARLVFDRRHTSLVILNDDPATKDTDEEVIGSICYRAFPEMRFAEIAFCAVNASHQVKGYGTKLMNLVKQEGARTGIEYFITYADNYAIGYFKKQGFTKNISMPKGRYQGLIKDYDGGTMMECYVHPSIDFTRIPEMLAAQREYILSRIRLKAQSHKVVYDPLPKNFNPRIEGVSRANESAARALAVPGVREAGWKLHDLVSTTGQGKDMDRAKNALKSELISIIRKVEEQQFAWPFREPVDTDEVKDYLEIIKEPIDLSTIDKRIRKGDHYKSRKMLFADLMLMVNNCKLYNDEASTYVQCAINLEKYLKVLL